MGLPKVHVEASILTSIILAGLLLKGGIILVLYLMNIVLDFIKILILVLILFLILSSLILIRQTDFKALVAYSSVLHITFCALRFLILILSGNFRGIFIGLVHRFISPLIFLLVYFYYQKYFSRKLFSNIFFRNKFLVLNFSLVYLFNLRFPILGRFISELIILYSILILNFNFIILVLILSFVLPVIFSFQILIFINKFNFRLNFNFIILINFGILILSLVLVYSILLV